VSTEKVALKKTSCVKGFKIAKKDSNLLKIKDDNFVIVDNQVVTSYYIEYVLKLSAAKKRFAMYTKI